MAAPLLYTKLYQPIPRPGVTPRPRLLRRLDEALTPGVRLALISAPAGYGKTTLVAGWLAQQKAAKEGLSAAWLSIDEGDNDPARFLGYLVAALRKFHPEIGSGVLSLLALPQLPPLDGLLSELINELYTVVEPSGASHPFLIVLDDFHGLRAADLMDGLQFFLERMPSNVRLVITTRADPPLPLSRMRVRGEVVELRASDLRFTAEESAAFFRETLGTTLDETALATLDTRTEGWIAGLQLAALALRENSGDPEALQNFLAAFSGSHRYVIDYLVDEVLAKQPEDVRRFLLATSILSRFNAQLCGVVTSEESNELQVKKEGSLFPHNSVTSNSLTSNASPSSALLLEHLEKTNLFLVPLDSERKWYRYHRLFSDVLRAGLDADTEAALHRRAAEWWEQNGDIEEAIQHRLAGKDARGAAALMASHALDFIRKGGMVTLNGWMNQLPEDVLSADPDLPIYKILGLMLTGQIAEALERFARLAPVVDAAAGDPQTPTDRIRHGRRKALQAWFSILRKDLSALRFAEEAVDLLHDQDPFFHVLALIPLGSMLRTVRKDFQGSTRAFQEAFETGVRSGNLFGALGGLANVLFNFMEMGRLVEARQLCQQIFRQYVDSRGRPLPLQGLVYIPYAAVLLAQHNLDEAEQYAQRGLELCDMLFSSMMMGGDGEMILAQVAFWRGDPRRAFALIDENRQASLKNNLVIFAQMAESLEAHLHLRLGELAPVQRWVEERGLRSPERLSSRGEDVRHIYARLLMAEGRGEEACAILNDLERGAALEAREGVRLAYLIRLALFKTTLGRQDTARQHIREALRIAAPEGFRHHFIREGRPIVPLLVAARDVAPTFVDELLEDIAQSTRPKPANATPLASRATAGPVETFVEPLSEQERNVLRLLSEGKSNQEIAEELYISVGTAKWHVHNILGKLEVTSRTQAIARSRELHLL